MPRTRMDGRPIEEVLRELMESLSVGTYYRTPVGTTLTEEMIEDAARRSAENFGVPGQFFYRVPVSGHYSISGSVVSHSHTLESPTEGVIWCITCGRVIQGEDIVKAAMAELGISE